MLGPRRDRYLTALVLFFAFCAASTLLVSLVDFHLALFSAPTDDCATYAKDAETYEKCANAISAEAVAFFTKLLAYATFGLVITGLLQIVLLFRADATSKKLAFSATKQTVMLRSQKEIARRQYESTYRPHLVVRNMRSPDTRVGNAISVFFDVINNGHADTKIVSSAFYGYLVTGTNSYHYIDVPVTDGKNLLGISEFPMSAVAAGVFNGGTWTQAHMNLTTPPHQGYFIGGKILYLDGNGRNRRFGFFRKFDPVTRRFRAVDDPEYEYDD